jgi:polyhydroxyalkanoate synthesis regulator protein
MKAIKRYRNRKLYDINLTNIADHVKNNGTIQVIDFNGQDITKKILGQVIADLAESMTSEQLMALIIVSNEKKIETVETWERP